ncbi:MAG: M15 family metallopeptidase [Lachnospiraceae bacterium]|nr:M15 family metallopeptidase [Lachnospiraceae bacterium]
MYSTFNERVVQKAARISKKHKFLTPVMYLYSAILVGAYFIGRYFYRHGKRYISVVLALIFFLMGSSFSFPDNSDDNEIYLSSQENSAVENTEASTNVLDDETGKNLDNVEWIEDLSLMDEVDDSDLSKTDNVEKYTLDDFLEMADINTATYYTGESGFDRDAWNLILVNKTHPVPDDYEVPLTTITGSMKCDERVLEPLTTMLKAAMDDGINLIVCSPYRDYALQTRLFNRKIDLYMGKGYSYLEAYKLTSQKVTVPGASEHQIGMAFDIVTSSHSTLDYEFGDTKAGKWLKEHGKEYGFILRYPRGKEYITSIEYEPWHFRYVGVEAATYIMDNGLTLEEFLEGLQ